MARTASRQGVGIPVYTTVIAVIVMTCMLLIGGDAWRVWQERSTQIAEDKAATANLARSMAQHAHDTMQATNTVLVGLRQIVETDGLAPDRLTVLHDYMTVSIAALPILRGLFVLDASGRWIVNSASDVPRTITYSDREYFQHHRSSPDRGIHVGPPVRSKSDGTWIVTVSHRIDAADGSFVGVVVAAISIDAIQRFYGQFGMGAQGAIALLSSDGVIIARNPAVERLIGASIPGGRLSETIMGRTLDAGSLKYVSPLDGITRLGSYRRVEDFPLVVVVSHGLDDALADWHGDAWYHACLGLCILIVFALLAQRFARQVRRGEWVEHRYRLLAEHSSDAILCVAMDGERLYVSPAFCQMTGWSDAESIERGWAHFIHPDDHERVGNMGQQLLEGSGHAMATYRYLCRDGSHLWVEASFVLLPVTRGMPAQFVAIIRDITERRANEERLLRLAHHDPLTGLPNRLVLCRRIEQLAHGHHPSMLLMIDLDGFKAVNDDHGHAVGDGVLRQVAQRLLGCVRATDTVARLGGDEFAVLLDGMADHARAGRVAETIIGALSRSFVLDCATVSIGASIGIALYPGDDSSTEELLSSADLALYQAKNDGRHCHRAFTPELRSAVDRARAYDNELRRAHENGEFEVFYQPQVRLSDNALVGAEALLRWRHPRDGLLSPAAFMEGLENRPISVEVGQWVLRTACGQAAAWHERGEGAFRIGVNLFGSQLRSGDLVGSVREALAVSGLPAGALELEVTENVLLRSDDSMVGPLRELRADGVQIAFDDYGTGYTSLGMLKRFPITRLKIDRSFVQGMAGHPEDAAIVRAILYLARSLGFAAIAEGVETHDQAERLRIKGCEEVQGYLFGHPMPAKEFTAYFDLHWKIKSDRLVS